MLLTPGWYQDGWWKGTEEEDSVLGCSEAERIVVLKDTLAVWRYDFRLNLTGVMADSGIVS